VTLLDVIASTVCHLGWLGAFCFEVTQYYAAFRKPRKPTWLRRPGAWVTTVLFIACGGPATFYLAQLKPGLAASPYPFLIGFVWSPTLLLAGRAVMKIQEIRRIQIVTGGNNDK
jgi:hypothetical protein